LIFGSAVIGCAVALAACGSSSNNKPQRHSGQSQFLAFSQCMRAHGVTHFPDPSPSGGIQISTGSGVNPFSPSFKAARTTCGKLLPGGGPGGHGPPSAQDKAQMLAISTCMRAHGVSGFPDPTTTPPNGPNGVGDVIGRNGVFIAVPSTIDTNSPAYQHAASACHFG
jgi:hypothetical protein